MNLSIVSLNQYSISTMHASTGGMIGLDICQSLQTKIIIESLNININIIPNNPEWLAISDSFHNSIVTMFFNILYHAAGSK